MAYKISPEILHSIQTVFLFQSIAKSATHDLVIPWQLSSYIESDLERGQTTLGRSTGTLDDPPTCLSPPPNNSSFPDFSPHILDEMRCKTGNTFSLFFPYCVILIEAGDDRFTPHISTNFFLPIVYRGNIISVVPDWIFDRTFQSKTKRSYPQLARRTILAIVAAQ